MIDIVGNLPLIDSLLNSFSNLFFLFFFLLLFLDGHDFIPCIIINQNKISLSLLQCPLFQLLNSFVKFPLFISYLISGFLGREMIIKAFNSFSH